MRTLTIDGRTLTLPNLYVEQPDRPPVTVVQHRGATVIRFMGWFVDRAMPYRMHDAPAEECETGIARRWVEQVRPRTRLRVKFPTERLSTVSGIPRERFAPKACSS